MKLGYKFATLFLCTGLQSNPKMTLKTSAITLS